MYKKGAADPNVDYYLIWQYTGGAGSGTSAGTVAGTLTMDKETVEGEPWPLPKGDYVLYYLLADGYEWVAEDRVPREVGTGRGRQGDHEKRGEP